MMALKSLGLSMTCCFSRSLNSENISATFKIIILGENSNRRKFNLCPAIHVNVELHVNDRVQNLVEIAVNRAENERLK